MSTIKVYYHDIDMPKISQFGDWADLYTADEVSMEQGSYSLISLGVTIQLPTGYEAYVVPRSSTFKNFGILQTNGMGIIDEAYRGISDVWKFPAYATRKTFIPKYSRICQFRIQKKADMSIVEASLDNFTDKSRGGFGSTGVK